MKRTLAAILLLTACAVAQNSDQQSVTYEIGVKYLLSHMKDPDSTQIASAAWVDTKYGRNLIVEFRSKNGYGGYALGELLYLSKKDRFRLDTDYSRSPIGRHEWDEVTRGKTSEDVTADFKAVFTKLHTLN